MKKPSDQIINKVLDNEATKEQAKQVAQWFATAKGQDYLKNTMNKQHYKTEDFKSVEFIENEFILPIRKKQRTFRLMRIAAAIVPIMVLSLTLWYLSPRVDFFDSSDLKTIVTAKGETTQMVFQDGTHMYLHPDSKITFPEKFGLTSRKVTLNGEAYFDVSKNPKKPFLIELENASIKVLGTSFRVSSYPESKKISIVLDEGNIVFSTKDKKKNLVAGQELRFDKISGEILVTKKTHIDFKKGKDIIMFFKQDRLEDVLNSLNKWYNISFVIEDASLNNLTYTTTFKNNSLEEVLTEIEKISPVKFSVVNDTVFIKRVKNKFN